MVRKVYKYTVITAGVPVEKGTMICSYLEAKKAESTPVTAVAEDLPPITTIITTMIMPKRARL